MPSSTFLTHIQWLTSNRAKISIFYLGKQIRSSTLHLHGHQQIRSSTLHLHGHHAPSRRAPVRPAHTGMERRHGKSLNPSATHMPSSAAPSQGLPHRAANRPPPLCRAAVSLQRHDAADISHSVALQQASSGSGASHRSVASLQY